MDSRSWTRCQPWTRHLFINASDFTVSVIYWIYNLRWKSTTFPHDLTKFMKQDLLQDVSDMFMNYVHRNVQVKIRSFTGKPTRKNISIKSQQSRKPQAMEYKIKGRKIMVDHSGEIWVTVQEAPKLTLLRPCCEPAIRKMNRPQRKSAVAVSW